MVRVLVTVFDKKSRLYGNLMLQANEEVAKRTFQMEASRAADDNALYCHPDDFELVLVGRYDDESGHVDVVYPPQVMLNGVRR